MGSATEADARQPWSDSLGPHAQGGSAVWAIFPFRASGHLGVPVSPSGQADITGRRWTAFGTKENSFLPALMTHHDFGGTAKPPGGGSSERSRRAWSRSLSLENPATPQTLRIDHHDREIEVAVSDISVHFFDTGSCSTLFVVLHLRPADKEALSATDLLTILNAQCFRERSVLDPTDISGAIARSAGLLDEQPGRPESSAALSVVHLRDAGSPLVDSLAHALLVGLPPKVVPDNEGLRHRDNDGIFRRDTEITYIAGHSAANILLNASSSTSDYVTTTLPLVEAGTIYLVAYLYALHQRSALVTMSAQLAELPLLEADADDSSSDALAGTLDAVTRIRLDFERLIAWTRYRVVSNRPGLQQFYDVVHHQLRLNDLEDGVRRAIEGTTSLTNFQLSQVQLELERRETHAQERVERAVRLLGIPTVVLSLAFSALGMEIDGLSSPGGWAEVRVWWCWQWPVWLRWRHQC